ncbi:MAG: YciI family protein [Chitinophagaceae bacterium]
MKEFVFIFRSSKNPHANPSPEQIQERMNWISGIAAQNKMGDKGNRTSVNQARVVKPDNTVSDSPYTVNKEFVTGYMVVIAENIDEAVKLAQTNPIIKAGGSVEIRAVLQPGEQDL